MAGIQHGLGAIIIVSSDQHGHLLAVGVLQGAAGEQTLRIVGASLDRALHIHHHTGVGGKGAVVGASLVDRCIQGLLGGVDGLTVIGIIAVFGNIIGNVVVSGVALAGGHNVLRLQEIGQRVTEALQVGSVGVAGILGIQSGRAVAQVGIVEGVQLGVSFLASLHQLHQSAILTRIGAMQHDLGIGILAANLIHKGVDQFVPAIQGSGVAGAIVSTKLDKHHIGLTGEAILAVGGLVIGRYIVIDILHACLLGRALSCGYAGKQTDAATGNQRVVRVQFFGCVVGIAMGGRVVCAQPLHTGLVLAQCAVAAGDGVTDELDVKALVGRRLLDGAAKGQSGQVGVAALRAGHLGLLDHTHGMLTGRDVHRERAGGSSGLTAPHLRTIYQNSPVGGIAGLEANGHGAAVAGDIDVKAGAGPVGSDAVAGLAGLGTAQGLDLALAQQVHQLVGNRSRRGHSCQRTGDQTQYQDHRHDQGKDSDQFLTHKQTLLLQELHNTRSLHGYHYTE